ncbi:hypothetical protein BC940DRAFT_301366 [Gongronella butleri]|nr:hypothetical protein BC940DRAFT_301366 [Gongronella butleri]
MRIKCRHCCCFSNDFVMCVIAQHAPTRCKHDLPQLPKMMMMAGQSPKTVAIKDLTTKIASLKRVLREP